MSMHFVAQEGPPATARWANATAMFSAMLMISALFLHRLFSMPTPTALNLAALSLIGAVLAIVLALLAAVRIWRRGGHGTAHVLAALLISAGLLGWPLSVLPMARQLPEINDVTTDVASPPEFVALAGARKVPANGATYRGPAFAELQAKAYPDLVPLKVNRPREETFDLVVEAVRRQKMTVAREEPPTSEPRRPGTIEAVDRTLIIGFYDDVTIRVDGDDKASVVDIRSASRYGRHDFGRNAERVRRLMREIVTRLEASVPGSSDARGKGRKPQAESREVKPGKGATTRKPSRRRRPARVQ